MRLPKDRVQKLKKAYMGWEKGSIIVFILIKRSPINVQLLSDDKKV